MKRILIIFLALAALTPNMWAVTVDHAIDGINYRIDLDSNTARAIGFEGTPPANLFVPSVITRYSTEYPVVGCPFSHYGSLSETVENIEFSEGITYISAPSDFKNLQTVILPSSLERIYDGKSYVSSSDRNDNLEIKWKSDNIKSIGNNAFKNISHIELGEKIESIGDEAFGDDIRIISIKATTPPTLKSRNMGYGTDKANKIVVIVPKGCSETYRADGNWNEFTIVEEGENTVSVHLSGKYSLAEEIRMQTSLMPGSVTKLKIYGPLSDTDWRLIDRNLISCYDLDLSEVTNQTIPTEAFRNNGRLVSLALPKNLKTIESGAFNRCYNLTIKGEKLPDNLTSIGSDAFKDCYSLELGVLPENLQSIGKNAFSNCSRLQLTRLPALTMLGEYAFAGCKRLFEMDMSVTAVESITPYCFSGCTNLRIITLPKNITAIEMDAFSGTSLNFIDLPSSIRKIEGGAFENTDLISINIPKGCTKLGYKAFYGCSKMTTVNLSPSVNELGESCFEGGSAIRMITVPCVTPPGASGSTFSGVSRSNCIIAIPTLNFRDYLNALEWGSFIQLSNSLFLDYQEMDENGDPIDNSQNDAIDIGVIENSDYETVVEAVINEEENAAEDKLRDENFFGKAEQHLDEEALQQAVCRVRSNARSRAEAEIDSKTASAFARLYNNVSLTIGNNAGYKVRITPADHAEIVKIEFNGEDITSLYDGLYLSIPEINSGSTLKVYRRSSKDEINTPTAIPADNGNNIIYNLQGMPVRNPGHGIYIINGKKVLL